MTRLRATVALLVLVIGLSGCTSLSRMSQVVMDHSVPIGPPEDHPTEVAFSINASPTLNVNPNSLNVAPEHEAALEPSPYAVSLSATDPVALTEKVGTLFEYLQQQFPALSPVVMDLDEGSDPPRSPLEESTPGSYDDPMVMLTLPHTTTVATPSLATPMAIKILQLRDDSLLRNSVYQLLDQDPAKALRSTYVRDDDYPAIAFSLLADIFKARRQRANGNLASAAYTVTGGLTMAVGSAVVLEAGFAVAGATTVVPFAGWAAAALVLAGVAIIAGGLYLHTKAHEHVHSPIELWVARSIFGNRLNDGEDHPNITLDHEKKLPRFSSLHEEVRVWHNEHYGPKLLSAEQAISLGVSKVDTRWHDNDHWALPNWTAITHHEVSTPQPTVEFAVLLPGFVIGTSQWSASLSTVHKGMVLDVFPVSPTGQIVDAGLILHFENTLTKQNHVSLHLAYSTNQGLEEHNEIHSIFRLER